MNEQQLVNMMQLHKVDLKDGLVGAAVSQSVADGLRFMAWNQDIVSKSVPGCMPESGEPVTKDMIRTYSLATIIELTEFVQELDWKPWKDKSAVEVAKVTEEFADVLAFMGILVSYLQRMGISAEDLGEAYRLKSIKNVERFLGAHEAEYKRVAGIVPEEK